MIEPYKGRSVSPGDRVDVYRNLTKDCWSLRAVSGPHKGQVVGHAPLIALENCRFIVNKAGRERVLREKRKNVHAFVRGRITDPDVELPSMMDRTRYNPYEADHFTDPDGNPVQAAMRVYCSRTGRMFSKWRV